MAFLGLTNTPLINYFFYKQATIISGNTEIICHPFTAVADAGNGQIVFTTTDTSTLSVGTAITIAATTNYDGNYSIISFTSTTFNVSGIFVATEVGTWELASNITGASVGDPLDFGLITFYDNDDQITLQDTYQDRALTVLNTNPLILDAVGSAPPIYMIDNPYYITIHDKFNNLVAVLENYLPEASSDLPDTSIFSLNLFPNYGFDSQINQNIFDLTAVPISGATAVSAGWFWDIETTQTDAENFYSYVVVSDLGLEGNPKNEVVLRSTNNVGGKSVNRLFCVLGDYNILQGEALAVSIYTNAVSGSAISLQCNLRRTRAGVLETAINVGSIAISATRTQQTFSFTVPILADSNYSNDDSLQFEVALPLNSDLAYGFTGSWCQLSPTGALTVTESPGALRAANEFFGESFRQLQASPQYVNRGLPLVVGEGSAAVLNTTGSIFQGGIGSTFSYAASMLSEGDEGNGVELLQDTLTPLSQSNRLIAYIRGVGGEFLNSIFTFIATPVSDSVTVTLGQGSAPNTSWVSLAPTEITVTKTTDELVGALKAQTTGNGLVVFTFSDNFDATTNAFNPQFSFAAGPLYSVLPTALSPMIATVGNFDLTAIFSSTEIYDRDISIAVVDSGSVSTPAVVKIRFENNEGVNFLFSKVSGDSVSPQSSLDIYRRESRYAGHATDGVFREFLRTNLADASVNNIQNGFISYNDITDNPSTQLQLAPRVIRFDANGPSGGISTITVPMDLGDDRSEVATLVAQAVNTSFLFTLDFLLTPSNGTIVQISSGTGGTDFNLIFWDINISPTRPANPDTRVPIYVQFTTAQSLSVIAIATATAIEEAVIGVPRAADLGLTFSSGLEYFMVL